MTVTGLVVFVLGMVGMLVGSKGRRGWDRWTGRQQVVCSVSFVLVIAGLALADAGHGR